MNWGRGIVLAIVLFIGFIMYFVIDMTTNSKYDHDLVTEKYYEKELTYQKKLDASQNAKNLGEGITYKRTPEGLLITFPKVLEPKEVKGKVFLYRPSNKNLDFELPISLSNNNLLVPEKSLLDGRWNMTIDVNHKGTPYLFTKEIVY